MLKEEGETSTYVQNGEWHLIGNSMNGEEEDRVATTHRARAGASTWTRTRRTRVFFNFSGEIEGIRVLGLGLES